MFGFILPPEFLGGFKKKLTIEDIKIGDHYRDNLDKSLWRVSYKDDRVHIINTSDLTLRVVGVNIFVELYSLVEYGAKCIKCNKENEYAERNSKFRCWACKNGF